MSKVRINDLARELEVKSRPILDALEAIGVSGKTHSSSIEADQAEKVRNYINGGSRSPSALGRTQPVVAKIDLSKAAKPGDAVRAILERRQAEAAVKAAPPAPTRPVVAASAQWWKRGSCCGTGAAGGQFRFGCRDVRGFRHAGAGCDFVAGISKVRGTAAGRRFRPPHLDHAG